VSGNFQKSGVSVAVQDSVSIELKLCRIRC
jgi:hypothetical protein